MVYNKVVRDKVIAIMSNRGMYPETTMLTAKAFLEALKAKLLEECKEFIQAKEHKDKVEELADMMEVALAIMKRENVTMDQVLKKRSGTFNLGAFKSPWKNGGRSSGSIWN